MPRPASSAAAVGMETSTQRTGSQLAQTAAARHSASSRGEAARVSSRDELAEMAAASQGKGGRGPPVAPRGAAFPGSGKGWAPLLPGQAAPSAPRNPRGAGAGEGAGALAGPSQGQRPRWSRPFPGVRLRAGSSAFRPRPGSLDPATFGLCSRKRSGTQRLQAGHSVCGLPLLAL